MNGFIPKTQKLKCPKCGKTKIVTSGCVPNFEVCPKCEIMMIPCKMNFVDKILGKFKA